MLDHQLLETRPPAFDQGLWIVKVQYKDESDAGPFPVPVNLPIEGWPLHYEGPRAGTRLTLDEVQRDARGLGGDRCRLRGLRHS